MSKKLLSAMLVLSLLFPMACTKPAAEAAEPVEPDSSSSESVVQVSTGVDDLELIDEFIKNSPSPDDYDQSDLEAIYPYVSNRLFALLACSGEEENLKNWLELYDGMIVTTTYEMAELNHYERGLYPSTRGVGCKVGSFKESANYENNDFAAVLRDSINYGLEDTYRYAVYITVKGRVDGSRELQDAELVSWAVAEKDKDMFEDMRLKKPRQPEDDSIVIDYDYVWSKYSENITTFEHQAGVADKLEIYKPSAEEVAAMEAEKQEAEAAKAVKLPFSDSTSGQLLGLMNDCTGEDLDTAVKMLEAFFGTELVNTATVEQTIEDEVWTYNTSYYMNVSKDDFRFNRINIFWNMDDEKVCGVEFGIRNEHGEYAFSELDPLPDLEEVDEMYSSFTDEAVSVCGEAFQSGNLYYDDDSYWTEYEYGNDCIIRLEIYNYTSEGENGLVAGKIQFRNSSYY